MTIYLNIVQSVEIFQKGVWFFIKMLFIFSQEYPFLKSEVNQELFGLGLSQEKDDPTFKTVKLD